jgi:Mg2+-importing ATPase
VRLSAFLNAAFESGIENPLDQAIVRAGQESGLATDGYAKVDEIPYDFLRKRLSIVVRAPGSDAARLICKGAFDTVLSICTNVATPDGIQALDDLHRARLAAFYREKGSDGFRVLGVAVRDLPVAAHYGHGDEAAMTFLGFLLFFDPPKASARSTIKSLADRGIAIKIITGDNRHVACHVAAAIGLDPAALMTGEEIARQTPQALWHLAASNQVFAEIDPQQKELLVRSLRRAGHVVGFLGDGINDAPALHAADVGISVDQAVDVARQSADIVLLKPDLDVLRTGVEEGRTTFANTIKYIALTISANFGNMISMALATPLLPFLPLAAKQILLNNFLTDIPALAISSDRVDEAMLRSPQRWDIALIRRFMILFGLASSVFDGVTFFLLLRVFHAGEALFHTAWFVISVLTELAALLVLRTRGWAWHSRPSGFLLGLTAITTVLGIGLPFWPRAAALFAFVPIPAALLFAAVAIVTGYALANELLKRIVFSPGANFQSR